MTIMSLVGFELRIEVVVDIQCVLIELAIASCFLDPDWPLVSASHARPDLVCYRPQAPMSVNQQ